MEDAITEVNDVVSATTRVKRLENYFSTFSLTAAKIKLLGALTLGSFFGCGLRSAYRHTRGQELHKLKSGLSLGLRALGIASVLSVSSVGLLVLGVSALLNVDSPKEFGQTMTNLFGDRFRIDQGKSFTTFAEVLEGASTKEIRSTE